MTKLDWEQIWEAYESEQDKGIEEDPMWAAVDKQVVLNEDYKIQIDEMWNDMMEEFLGEEVEDDVDYELPIEHRLELQGAFRGAVEFALAMQENLELSE